MKNILALSLFAIWGISSAHAQFVKNEWGRLVLSVTNIPDFSGNTIEVYDMRVDASDNTIVVGSFNGPMDFDPSAGQQIEGADNGKTYGYIAKYSPTGALVWANVIEPQIGSLPCRIYALTTDANGAVYVAGSPGGITDLDPGPGVTLTPSQANYFMAKYNAAGELVWGSGSYLLSDYKVSALFVNHQGQLVRLGGVSGAGTDVTLFSVEKFDTATGLLQDSYPITAVGSQGASNSGVVSGLFEGLEDNGNNFICIARFRGSLDMDMQSGESVVSSIEPNNQPAYNYLIAKYNPAMELQWAFNLHSSNTELPSQSPVEVNAIATDPAGNIYVGGTLRDTIDFDPGAGEYFVYPSTGSSGNTQRGFVAKYAPDGSLIWAKPIDINDPTAGSTGGRSLLYELALTPDGQRIYFSADIVDRPKLLNMEENPILMPHVSSAGEQTEFNFVLGAMDSDGNVTQANTVLRRGGSWTMPENHVVSKNHLRTLSDGSIHAAFERLGVIWGSAVPYYFGACQNDTYGWDGLNRNAIGIARYVPCTDVPVISSQPLSTQVCLGLPLTVEVAVSGATCTKKHWFKRSSDDTHWLTPVQSEELFFASFSSQDVGEYIVTVEGECGSVTSNVFTLTIADPPAQPTVTQSGAELVSSYATGNQWYFEGSIIDGATGQTYTPTQNGNYTVLHTDANACEAESEAYNMLTVGISTATDGSFTLRPNPTDGPLLLQFTTDAQRIATLMDATGREVFTASLTGTAPNLILDGLSSGIYLLRVAEGSTMHHTRVVKQ